MNCVRWSMGDASLHGMGTSWVPGQCFGCYPCPWTKLLPMCPDRTNNGLTRACSRRRKRRAAADAQAVSRTRADYGHGPGRLPGSGIVLRYTAVSSVVGAVLNHAEAAMRRFACPGSLALVLIALLFVPLPAFAQAPKVVTESYHVPTRDPGMELYVRNKRPEGVSRFGAERIL